MKKALFIGSLIGLVCGVVAEVCFIVGVNKSLVILILIGLGLMYIAFPVAGVFYLIFSVGPGQWVYIAFLDPLMEWIAMKFGFSGTSGSFLWYQAGVSVIIGWVVCGGIGGVIYTHIKRKRDVHKHGKEKYLVKGEEKAD